MEIKPGENIDNIKMVNDGAYAFPKIAYKDTLYVINLKETYGFYLNHLVSENKRILLLNQVNNYNYEQNYLNKILTDENKFVGELDKLVKSEDIISIIWPEENKST